ncbi:hypothetical protein JHK82_050654 [Glycine max]|nr:hypothetical protein JHK85_051368 [Glycine max]KAG5091876.1 hypothetical protein JHK82_050654 [Glycine max]
MVFLSQRFKNRIKVLSWLQDWNNNNNNNNPLMLVELVGLLVIVWSWDEQFLVESYMAYYIVVHNLQNGGMYGSNEAVKKHVKFSKNISAAIVATTTTEEIPEYKLPSWAKFEIGKVAVYWKPMNGLPPTSIRRKAVDLILPFGEIEVLKENWDLIKRQIGLENVEILSAANGLIVSSHKESLKHFKKPWAHVHELVKEVVNVVKIKSTTSGLDYFFIKANFGILDDVGALWNPSTIDHVIPD